MTGRETDDATGGAAANNGQKWQCKNAHGCSSEVAIWGRGCERGPTAKLPRRTHHPAQRLGGRACEGVARLLHLSPFAPKIAPSSRVSRLLLQIARTCRGHKAPIKTEHLNRNPRHTHAAPVKGCGVLGRLPACLSGGWGRCF